MLRNPQGCPCESAYWTWLAPKAGLQWLTVHQVSNCLMASCTLSAQASPRVTESLSNLLTVITKTAASNSMLESHQDRDPAVGLACTLKPYQQKAVAWMLAREEGIDARPGGRRPVAASSILGQKKANFHINSN